MGFMSICSSSTCTSCCSKCLLDKPEYCATRAPNSPFALHKLIPAGTLSLDLYPDGYAVECNHAHLEDGWHLFNGNHFEQHLLVNAEPFREIDFLTTHRFIYVTYCIQSSTLVVLRIYLIPWDLQEVQGQLRRRKETILSSARRFLRNLLPLVIQDQDSWTLGLAPRNICPKLFPTNQDHRTLSEIYSDLKSPDAREIPGESITGRLLDFRDNLAGLGMRHSLYRYQRRSVAAMMRQELDSSDIPDPLFIPLQSMGLETFYWQPGTMEVLQERPMTAACQNGILCEELGTGKTVMILGLIQATLHRISSPEESFMGDRPVLTPLSFRCFQSSECVSARKPFLDNGSTFPNPEPRVPSLVETLLHRMNTAPDTRIFNTSAPSGIGAKDKNEDLLAQLEQLPLAKQRRKNTPFYLQFQDDLRPHRGKFVHLGPRIMYLTSATLVIVPPNLLSQWDREIQKHCEYPVRVLILRTGLPMPDAASLASDYDIILMTYKRFTSENGQNTTDKLQTWKVCRCPSLTGSRVPDCNCKRPQVSPLLQVRWKRLVIDEGHVSASLVTILTPFTKLLSVERRWIVTGTPTTNLLGLSLGNNTAHEQTDDSEDVDMDASDSGIDDQSQSSLVPTPRSTSPSTLAIGSLPRAWTFHDREDIGKLGKMISHFIQVPQFAASPKLITTHIIEPLLDPQGPRPGAIQVLNQVMEMTMIRHRIKDVEEDVILPPINHESVFLDLDPYAVKSYNAMQAGVAINAVDSQRTDQDYIFHPRNVESLQTAVQNMSQLMFWSADERLYNVIEMSKNLDQLQENAKQRNVPPEDMDLLNEASRHIRIAAEDPLWRSLQCDGYMPYRMLGFDRNIFKAWTRSPHPETTHNSALVGFIHADRLLKLQEKLTRFPTIELNSLQKLGRNVADSDLTRQLQFESQQGKGRKSTAKPKSHQDEIHTSMKAGDTAKKALDPSRLKEMKRDLNIALQLLDDENEESYSESLLTNPTPELEYAKWKRGVRIGSTASSKLNYIINEVLQYAANEKFLIFSDFPLSLSHIGDALQLMRIKYLRFTTQINPRIREEMVLTFETSSKYRVFLMELKHGARGLNLISASRVIFCEPVWQADVESQAIKRSHRIGQTRTITVKTLAIRGTAEENMVSRRNLLKDRQERLPKLIEEAGMRHYIANPKFINYLPERYATVEMPFLTAPPSNTNDVLVASTSSSPGRSRGIPVENIDLTATKRQRTVHFA